MKLEGRIRLEAAEIKQAIAEYVGKAYGLAVPVEQVSIYHIEDRGYSPQYHATVAVDDHVAVTNGVRNGD